MRITLPRIFALVLIIGSIFFTVLILTNKPREANPLSASLSENIPDVQPENLPDTSATDQQNLTAQAADEINQQVSSAATVNDLQNPETLVADYLAKAAKNFDYNSLRPAVDVNRLNISSVLDQRLLAIYVKGFNDALGSTLGSLKLSGANSQKNLEILAGAYAKSIEALYLMPVPRIFASLHEKMIANLGAQKSAAEIISRDYLRDPVRAMLALDAVSKLGEEFKAIQKNISDLASKNSS